jgi:hypothetical protein
VSGRVIDFPIAETLRPEQAIGEAAKVRWTQVLVVGFTEAGDFEVVNSDMTAERALWLLEWGKRWALGVDDDE